MRVLKDIFFGIVVVILLGVGMYFYAKYSDQKGRFVCEYVLSAEGVRKVGDGIAAYTKAKSHRPGSLGELVSSGYISQADLFDASRRKQVDSEGKPITPDVIYFSALRPDDPPDTVLLCTVLRENKDDKYSVVFNDGRFAQLTRQELVNALNRTYSHICQSLPKTEVAHKKAIVAPQ